MGKYRNMLNINGIILGFHGSINDCILELRFVDELLILPGVPLGNLVGLAPDKGEMEAA